MLLRRYLKLAKHLWDEIRGRCKYDPSLKHRAIESKVFEGVGEAIPQLLLQSYLITLFMWSPVNYSRAQDRASINRE